MSDANQDLVHAVDQLRKSVDQLRDELVRKDVFDQVLQNINHRFKNVEEDIARAESNRSRDRLLILTGLVFPALVGILLLYVAAQIGGSPT